MLRANNEYRIGIVGHEAAKFTPETQDKARKIIEGIFKDCLELTGERPILVSGGCHLGGIDIWAEEEAARWDIGKIIHLPKSKSWLTGYKPRNIKIAQDSDVVHVIVVKMLPESYMGMRFSLCYHCNTTSHVKSGGCWTARYARKLGKRTIWHEI